MLFSVQILKQIKIMYHKFIVLNFAKLFEESLKGGRFPYVGIKAFSLLLNCTYFALLASSFSLMLELFGLRIALFLIVYVYIKHIFA